MSSVTPSIAAHGPAVVARLRGAGCVFAEEEADLLVSAAGGYPELLSMVEQRVAGIPLEHIVGWVRFCGHRFTVAPGVFVPRARTGLLVREALALLTTRAAEPGTGPAVVVDLCCGCGAIGAAIAARAGRVRLHAVDIDPAAVACARQNVEPVGGRVYHGDFFEPLPDHLRRRVDVLVANVPYVPTAAMSLLPPEARLYESSVALDGGVDGLDPLRRLASESGEWLATYGHLLVETSERQAPAATEILCRAGLAVRVAQDEDLAATAVIATAVHP